jgi:hypothetical protein
MPGLEEHLFEQQGTQCVHQDRRLLSSPSSARTRSPMARVSLIPRIPVARSVRVLTTYGRSGLSLLVIVYTILQLTAALAPCIATIAINTKLRATTPAQNRIRSWSILSRTRHLAIADRCSPHAHRTVVQRLSVGHIALQVLAPLAKDAVLIVQIWGRLSAERIPGGSVRVDALG